MRFNPPAERGGGAHYDNSNTCIELLPNYYTPFQVSNSTDICRELLVNNTTRFSRVYIENTGILRNFLTNETIAKTFFRVQYSQRVINKQ